jgi:TetR/AcrR family transcriptional regulator, cholesterol catabolism regulator
VPTATSTDTGRDRIVDAAAALFLERGYASTSLRDIAAAAGIKAGSIYYHFDSKDDLLLEVLRRGIAVMADAFARTAEAAAHLPAGDRVAAHVRAHLSALFDHGPYTATHVSAFRTTPAAVRRAAIPDRDAYEALWAELLADLQRRGQLAADVDAHLARLSLLGAMNSAVEWFDPSRDTLDDLAAAIARQFWTGVAAAPAATT